MKHFDTKIHKIILLYEKNLQDFLQKNSLESTLADDIMERVYEKLSQIDNPKIADINAILTEIGTPEEIFADEISEKNTVKIPEKPTSWLQKFHASTDEILFLGTFFELAKVTNIAANAYRGIFLFLLLVSFLMGSVEIGVTLLVMYFLGFLLLRTGFFRFLFSAGLGLFFALLLIPSIALFGLYLGDFHIENIYFFEGVHWMFSLGMVLGIFSLIVLSLFFLRYAFTKKFLGIGFFLSGLLSLGIAIAIGVAVIFQYGSQFFYEARIDNRKYSFENPNPQEAIYLHPYFYSKDQVPPVGHTAVVESYYPHISPSEDNKIHLEVNIAGFSAKHLNNYLKDLDFTLAHPFSASENGFFVNNTPSNVITFVPKMTIDKNGRYPLMYVKMGISRISIPLHQRFSAYYYNIGDASKIIFPEYEKYSLEQRDIIGKYCEKYFFDEHKQLNCDINEQEIKMLLETRARWQDY